MKNRIALIKPLLLAHNERGTGTYAKNLYRAVKELNQVEIEEIDISSDYNSFDLLHFPYFDPFFLTLPLIRSKPTVVTVHDLIPLKFPNYFPRGVRGEIKWQIQKLAIMRADKIITDSFASEKDIIKYGGVDSKKIEVIRLGVGENFRPLEDQTKKETKNKLNPPEKFFLYVGDVNHNKNIKGLLTAFSIALQTIKDVSLVFIGPGFTFHSEPLKEIKTLIDSLNISPSVKIYGYVATEDLIALYNLALGLVQISLAEGFGLPVVEAFACGCPVIASNTSSLLEITDDAAMLVNPENPQEIARAMVRLSKDNSLQEKLAKKGIPQAKKFTWKKCARQTVGVYNSVLEKRMSSKL